MQNTVHSVEPLPLQDWHQKTGNIPYLYTFADGTKAEANHKGPAKYGPGQLVSYEIKGEYQGVSKIAFNQMQQGGAGPVQSPTQTNVYRQQQAARSQSAATTQPRADQNTGKPVFGATVGMAVNNAVQLTVAGLTPCPQGTKLSTHLRVTAWTLIKIASSLEEGWKPASSEPPATPPPPPPPPPPQSAEQYEEDVPYDEDGEDCPF